jgi:hypothetical protein
LTTSEYLYYESFHFQPETNPSNAGFSAFTSNLPSYYSALDSTTFGFTPTGGVGMSIACDNGIYNVASVKTQSSNPLTSVSQNGFTIEWDGSSFLPGCGPNNLFFTWTTNSYPTNNRGYFEREIVEGGSVMLQRIQLTPEGTIYNTSYYYAPRYPSSTVYNYNGLGTNNRQIIMRSDRLPLSTSVQETAYNSFALQNNSMFATFLISDETMFDAIVFFYIKNGIYYYLNDTVMGVNPPSYSTKPSTILLTERNANIGGQQESVARDYRFTVARYEKQGSSWVGYWMQKDETYETIGPSVSRVIYSQSAVKTSG